jgi:hypothetical protein
MQTLAAGCFRFYLAIDRIQIAATGRPANPPFERASFGQWRFPGSRMRAGVRGCLRILRGAAAGDSGRGQVGEVRASPQRAVRTEPTQVHGQKTRRPEGFGAKGSLASLLLNHRAPAARGSFCAPCHRDFCAKTAPLIIFRQSLRKVLRRAGPNRNPV